MAKYDYIEFLGGGAFGRVEKVRRKWDQKVFACKTIVYDGASRSERLAQREFEILARLNSPNIVRYVDAEWKSGQAMLYMEICEARSLDLLIRQYASRGTMIHEDYVWSIIYQLSNALTYCHHGKKSPIEGRNGASPEWTATILHRDIKPGNVFLSSTSEIALDAIKLGDFGLGVILSQGPDPSTYAGTRKYMPPEISSANIGPNKWTSKCDIFSLGCTLYELCALVSPFDDHMESEDDEFTPISNEYSNEVRFLISTCISFRPNDRPDAHKILETAKAKMSNNAEYKTSLLNFQLLEAAEKGDLENVLSLLENGAQIKAQSGTDGEGVLHRAAKSNNAALFPLLLTNEAELSALNQNEETPLHCAAAVGFSSAVRLLLNEGALVNLVDKRGWTAVHTAAFADHSVVVEMLLEEGNTIRNIDDTTNNEKRLTPLHIAVQNDCEATSRFLVNAGANIEALTGDGGVALHSAAQHGHATILNLLLEKGAKVGVKEQRENKATALHLAASGGHIAAVEILVQKRANMESENDIGETPLHSAAQHGHEPVIQLLVMRGADIQARTTKGKRRGWTALHLASAAGHDTIVETLVSSGLDVNTRTWDGESALHWAVGLGHKAVGFALLRHGANICMEGPNQTTPLHWAATSGQLNMVQLLIEQGAKLEEKTSNGETALLLAALYGHDAVVQQLLDSGAGIQASNRNGETALHLASREGKDKVVDLLLKKGANVKAKNSSGKTPLQVTGKNEDLAGSTGGVKLQQP